MISKFKHGLSITFAQEIKFVTYLKLSMIGMIIN